MNAKMLCDNEGIVDDIECVGAAFESLEGGRDVLGPPNLQGDHIEAQVPGGRLDLLHVQNATGVADIAQDRQPAEARDDFAQKLEPLSGSVGHLI
jgi:hypothetical protein